METVFKMTDIPTEQVVQSPEMKEQRRIRAAEYAAGFKAGIQAAAMKDSLSVLVSEIFHEWLQSGQAKQIFAQALDAAGLKGVIHSAVRSIVGDHLDDNGVVLKMTAYLDRD